MKDSVAEQRVGVSNGGTHEELLPGN